MVSPNDITITAIIDWGPKAGFYPEYWERFKFLWGGPGLGLYADEMALPHCEARDDLLAWLYEISSMA